MKVVSKMKILYVVSRAIQINSSSSIRNLSLIKGLTILGHDVTVLSSMYDKNHMGYDVNLEPQNVKQIFIKVGGIQKIASLSRKYKRYKILRQYGNKIVNFLSVYDNLKGIIKHMEQIDITDNMYDLIISSSDPKSSHLFVYKLYQKGSLRDTPWVQIWGDPFSADITRNSKLYKWRAKLEEKRLLGKATWSVYVSKLTLEAQKRRYFQYSDKMIFCAPGYVKEKEYQVKEITGIPKIVYCGNYSSKARNLLPFYRAMLKTQYNVVICGNGDISIENTEHIILRERSSFEEVEHIEEDADVLVYLCNKKGSQIPGKIYQYLGTTKYILFILDGEIDNIKKIFEPYARFVFCKNTEEDILDKLDKIFKGQYQHMQFVVKEFSPESRALDLMCQIGYENEY